MKNKNELIEIQQLLKKQMHRLDEAGSKEVAIETARSGALSQNANAYCKAVSLNLRVTISSIIMFYISNNLDIFLFEKIKKKLPNKLWVRNNVATIVSNTIENYFFIFFAFVGIYDIGTMLNIATTISIVEIVIALCDTPFVYLAKKLK